MSSISGEKVLHGVLMQVYSVGVLILGDAGAGKSDLALELLSRGHRLVADDVVEVSLADGRVSGQAPRRFAGVLEVRSLGLVDVRKAFGSEAFAESSKIDLVVELTSAIDPRSKNASFDVLSLQVPLIRLDLALTRAPGMVIETAARTFKVPGSLIDPEGLADMRSVDRTP